MSGIFISLGSNLGERKENLAQAITLLKLKCTVLKTSSIYETKPMYNLDQPPFLNQVIEIETSLLPHELLYHCLEIETNMGRVRTIKNEPRIIDLDVLLYKDVIINTTNLILPHPLIQDRAFVLAPLCDIAPLKIHPVLNKRMVELLEKVNPKDQIEKM
ncbi:2-amino-4-hydroxy-6-hydroxymethyldihydropteridine diphosphokinase [Candidatus Woesearchaeota archaeon]|nr:2-amino-4-hydroxy-6-hydroxymethyldihydropteridine diphosphokinase [Candidatus Woesearchaeota archaeon]